MGLIRAAVELVLSLWLKPQSKKPHPTFSPEELKRFLPSFLSDGSDDAFLAESKQFLGGHSQPFYTSALVSQPMLFQGDGLRSMPIIKLPDSRIELGRALLVSNTCDVDPFNKRFFDVCLTYAPILSLPRYLDLLRTQFPKERVDNHEKSIREQLITQILFLPQSGDLTEDSFVLLDRMMSASSGVVDRERLAERRIFTLSDFGAWLLALKLSVHFRRIRDQVDRTAGTIA